MCIFPTSFLATIAVIVIRTCYTFYVSVISRVTDAPLSKTKLRTESNGLTYSLPFESYLTTYAREATEPAESPVYLLIDIMAAEKNALLSTSEGMFQIDINSAQPNCNCIF
jgi:hypothetical protein